MQRLWSKKKMLHNSQQLRSDKNSVAPVSAFPYPSDFLLHEYNFKNRFGSTYFKVNKVSIHFLLYNWSLRKKMCAKLPNVCQRKKKQYILCINFLPHYKNGQLKSTAFLNSLIRTALEEQK